MQRPPAQQYDDFFNIPINLRAPLATFDTIDLGDEDILSLRSLSQSSLCEKAAFKDSVPESFTFSTKIGGAHSKGKDPASKTGSGPESQSDTSHGHHLKGESPCQDPSLREGKDRDDEDADDDATTPTNQSPAHSPPPGDVAQVVGSVETSAPSLSASSAKHSSTKLSQSKDSSNASGVQRIGKVAATWLSHQDSDSSSSSGSGSDIFTFRPIHGSTFTAAVRDEDDDDDEVEDEADATPSTRRRLVREKSKDYTLSLYPEDLDPSHITSPSRRKAFQKRLQRLQVKTSPIIRPRSTTPISVHTLEEYAAGSPDKSPASPFQDKLKITLPEEFSSRPKSPRQQRKPEVQDDSQFVFSEELLFSHSRSALVVDEVGQVPISPHSRRVLIPPTLSPSSSPKIGRAEGRFSGEKAPKLVYFEEKEEKFFGEPAAKEVSENWATFPEASESTDVGEPAAGADEATDTTAEQAKSGNARPDQSPVHHLYHSAITADQASASLPDEAEDEILTVNIQSEGPSKPANIQVVLSAASSTPSPSSPESSDEASKDSAHKKVEPQNTTHKIADSQDANQKVVEPYYFTQVIAEKPDATKQTTELQETAQRVREPQEKIQTVDEPQGASLKTLKGNTVQNITEPEDNSLATAEPHGIAQEALELNGTSDEIGDPHDFAGKYKESLDANQEAPEPDDYVQKPAEPQNAIQEGGKPLGFTQKIEKTCSPTLDIREHHDTTQNIAEQHVVQNIVAHNISEAAQQSTDQTVIVTQGASQKVPKSNPFWSSFDSAESQDTAKNVVEPSSFFPKAEDSHSTGPTITVSQNNPFWSDLVALQETTQSTAGTSQIPSYTSSAVDSADWLAELLGFSQKPVNPSDSDDTWSSARNTVDSQSTTPVTVETLGHDGGGDVWGVPEKATAEWHPGDPTTDGVFDSQC